MKFSFALLAFILSAASSLPLAAQSSEKPISETVDQIMGREHARGHLSPGTKRVKEEKLAAHRGTLPQNPDSPATGQFTGDTNAAASGGTGLAPQTAGTTFLAIQVSEAPFIPPDTQMAVGPSQILAIANGRIKVFDRNGNLGPLNADTDTFFSSVTANSTTDPRVRFDRLTGRWFVIMIDIPNSKKNNK